MFSLIKGGVLTGLPNDGPAHKILMSYSDNITLISFAHQSETFVEKNLGVCQ